MRLGNRRLRSSRSSSPSESPLETKPVYSQPFFEVPLLLLLLSLLDAPFSDSCCRRIKTMAHGVSVRAISTASQTLHYFPTGT